MFSSHVVARVLCACLGLGILFAAGSARAQFAECPLPTSYPETVYGTLVEQADVDFGGLTQTVCDGIVKKGVATCKIQVKAAAKCGHKAADGIYQIALKQCAQIADATDRASCKNEAKSNRSSNQDGYDSSLTDALAVCDGMFATALDQACMAIVVN